MGRKQRHLLWNQDDHLTTAEQQLRDRQAIQRLFKLKELPSDRAVARLLERAAQFKGQGLVG